MKPAKQDPDIMTRVFLDAIRRIWGQTGLTEEIVERMRSLWATPELIRCALDGLALIHPPRRHTVGSAGFDLVADITEPLRLHQHHVAKVPTGMRIAIPSGMEGQVRLRSSLSQQGVILVNGVGTIDSDYRGIIHVPLLALCGDYMVQPGERIAQLVLAPVWMGELDIVEAGELPASSRGEGGFGSTGRM